MTTPKPNGDQRDLATTAGGSLFGELEALAARAAGVPSPELIAQLANQLFSAVPGQPVAPPSAPPTPPIPAPDQSPGTTPAFAAQPTTADPSLLTLAGQPVRPPDSIPSATAHLPTAFAGPATPLAEPFPPPRESTADLGAIPASLGGELSLIRPLPAGTPTLPSAPTTPAAGSFYFVEEALAAAAHNRVPFRFETLTLHPESVEYSPARVPALDLAPRPFDPHAIRQDFPILQERVHGKRLIWLDNAATTQKPQAVIDRLRYYYEHENSNVHRAAHTLAARATDAYESARGKVQRFLNAASPQEIVFVRGTTEGINLVAQSWGRQNIGKDDEIVITWLEHHANIVPWQQLVAEKGARLRIAPVDDSGQVILEEYEKLLGSRTKLVAITQVSNALGTITPVHAMVAAAQRHGARVLVDGAQAVSHMRVDVQTLNPDFYVFSGHKVFGPTGIGAVYGRKEVLDTLPPWQGGGNMIADVTFERTVYQAAPARFEAGTGNIADAVGLGAALDYVASIGIETIGWYEHQLLHYTTEGLRTVPGLRIIGNAKEKAGVISFVLEGVRTEDVGKALDQEGIAVRSGHHCAQPILRRFGLESTVRASFAPYNTCEDADALIAALLRIRAHNGR